MVIEGVDWYCLEGCRLIGATTPDNTPVVHGLRGAEIYTTQFILASECKSPPKAGEVRSANLILTQFERIEPEDLKDKQIIAVRSTPEVLIFIARYRQYVKIKPSHGYDDDVELSRSDITISELHTMGQISDETWEKYKDDSDAERLSEIDRANIQRFRLVAAQVGLDTKDIEKILRWT